MTESIHRGGAVQSVGSLIPLQPARPVRALLAQAHVRARSRSGHPPAGGRLVHVSCRLWPVYGKVEDESFRGGGVARAATERSIVRRSLVTGGAGFIGSHLAEALLARGDEVTVVDDLSTGFTDNLRAVLDHPRFQYVEGSIADAALISRLLDDVDEVYHLAAAVGVRLVAEQPVRTIETNVFPTEMLLSKLVERNRTSERRLFLASTSEVYGKNPGERWREDDDMVLGPTTRARWAYGCSKAIDEFLALAYHKQCGLPVVVGRFFNVIGPRQVGSYGMVVPRFVDQAMEGGPVVVYDDGQQVRCFAHVGDVVRAVVELVACDAATGGVYNIGSDVPVTIRQLAEKVVELVDPHAPIKHIAYDEAYGAGFEDVRRRVPDLTRLRRTIGFEHRYCLEDAIREILLWKRRERAQAQGESTGGPVGVPMQET